MAVRPEYIAELALIDLAFALAEIRTSRVSSPEIQRALGHIENAVENLKTLVTDFDDSTPIDGA